MSDWIGFGRETVSNPPQPITRFYPMRGLTEVSLTVIGPQIRDWIERNPGVLATGAIFGAVAVNAASFADARLDLQVLGDAFEEINESDAAAIAATAIKAAADLLGDALSTATTLTVAVQETMPLRPDTIDRRGEVRG